MTDRFAAWLMRRRVRKGMAWLAAGWGADWTDRIDTRSLDIDHAYRCVIGQMTDGGFDAWHREEQARTGLSRKRLFRRLVRRGLVVGNLLHELYPLTAGDRLTREWVLAINDRKRTPVPSA